MKQYTTRNGNDETPFRIEIVAGGEVTHWRGTVRGQGTIAPAGNFNYAGPTPAEIPHAKEAIERARTIASDKLLLQAAQVGAEYVIGSDLKVNIREVPCGANGCELNDLDVEVSWFGTGVKRIAGPEGREKGLPPLVLAMMPLKRRSEAKEEPDVIEIAAEEAEELAAERAELNDFATEAAAEAAELARGGD